MGDLDRKIEVSFELTGEETVEEAIKKITDYVKSLNIELDRIIKKRTEEAKLALIEAKLALIEERKRRLQEKAARDAAREEEKKVKAEEKAAEKKRKLEEKAFRDAAKGYRQSHGIQVKLNKEAQETAELFASLYRPPVKYKPYKPFSVTKDIVDAAKPKYLGDEMIDAAEKVREATLKEVTSRNKATEWLGKIVGWYNKYKTAFIEMITDAAKKIQASIAQEVTSREKNVTWVDKITSGYKEYRKFLTGVLIDLHWLRVLGANSKIVSANVQMLGDAIGYVIDMILLPMLPAMIEIVKQIYAFGTWLSHLPKPIRNLIAAAGALTVGMVAIATLIGYVALGLAAFSTALSGATAASTAAAAGQTTLAAFGIGAAGAAGAGAAGAAIGGGIVSKFKPGVFFAPEMFPAMKGLGGEGEYSHDPRERLKILGKMLGLTGFAEGGIATSPTLGIFGEAGPEAIIPLNEIGNIMGQIFGAGAGITDTLSKAIQGGAGGFVGGLTTGGKGGATEVFAKGISWLLLAIDTGFKATNELLAGILGLIPNIGKIILGGAANIGELFLKWLTDSLGKTGELGKELSDAVIKWIVDGLGKTYNIAKELFDKVVRWIEDGFKNAYDIAKEIFNKVVKWVGEGLKEVYDIAKEVFDAIVKWVDKGLGNIYDIAKAVFDAVINWIKNGFLSIIDFATKVFWIVVDWIKNGFLTIIDFTFKVYEIVIGWVKSGFLTIVDFATKLYEIIVAWFGNGLASILDFSTKFFIMITTWVGEGLKNAVDFATAFYNTVKQWVKDNLIPQPDLATSIKDLIIEFVKASLKNIPIIGNIITDQNQQQTQPQPQEKKITKIIPVRNESGGNAGYWYYYSDGTREYTPVGSAPSITSSGGGYSGGFGGGGTGGRSGGGTGGGSGGSPSGGGNVTSNVVTDVTNTVSGAVTTVANTVSGAVTTVTNAASNVITGVTNVVSGAVDTVTNAASTVVTGVTNVVSGAVTTVANTVSGAVSTVTNTVSNIFGGLFSSIPKLQEGGYIASEGLAFLHAGETVVPAQVSRNTTNTPQIIINNPTFQISGRTDRELFENFLRMLKTEGARMV